MNVRWSTNTDKTVLTGTWDKIAGAQGFTFWRDGTRVSSTMSGSRTTVSFGLDGKPHIFEVYALGQFELAQIDHATTAYPLPTTPPPPPPPAATVPAGWDATKLTIAPNSANLISGFVPAAFGGLAAYATMVIARSINDNTAVPYTVTGGSSDRTIYVKPGTRPSLSDDHHLLIIDPARNRQHDLWAVIIDHTARTVKVGGGTSQPLNSVQEPTPGSSNAARLALEAFTVKLDEAKTGVIPHAVGFSMKATMIGGPSVYPANSVSSGPGSNLVFGQLLRFPPGRDFTTLGLPKLDLAICNAIRDHGMVLADGGSLVAFWCEDPQDEGGNQAWINAGFPVPNQVNGYPYAAAMSSKIPWGELQVCVPPPVTA